MTTPAAMRMPLESGDHLSREEFHRRSCVWPEIKKAELINGVVYVSSPVSAAHAEPHASLIGWLFSYKARHPGLALLDNGTVLLAPDSEVQPDATLLRVTSPWSARITAKQYVEGAPELVAEIAASSAAIDLHGKLRAYERADVLEYLVWAVYEQRFRWFRLREGIYVELAADADGIITSEVFPGLQLAVQALLDGDDRAVLAALDQPGAGRTDAGTE